MGLGFRRRATHHLGLMAFSAVLIALVMQLRVQDNTTDQLSFATAWLCLLFLGLALILGPLALRRTGPAPLNNYLRRDIGIWGALTGLAHFALGTEQSMNPVYLGSYVQVFDQPLSAGLRQFFFTWGTIIGLVIAVLFLLLLGLSNDRSLRGLGTRWWKRLQRSAYFAFALTVVHGFMFQALESRHALLVAALLLVVLAVVVLQFGGIARYPGARDDGSTDGA